MDNRDVYALSLMYFYSVILLTSLYCIKAMEGCYPLTKGITIFPLLGVSFNCHFLHTFHFPLPLFLSSLILLSKMTFLSTSLFIFSLCINTSAPLSFLILPLLLPFFSRINLSSKLTPPSLIFLINLTSVSFSLSVLSLLSSPAENGILSW